MTEDQKNERRERRLTAKKKLIAEKFDQFFTPEFIMIMEDVATETGSLAELAILPLLIKSIITGGISEEMLRKIASAKSESDNDSEESGKASDAMGAMLDLITASDEEFEISKEELEKKKPNVKRSITSLRNALKRMSGEDKKEEDDNEN